MKHGPIPNPLYTVQNPQCLSEFNDFVCTNNKVSNVHFDCVEKCVDPNSMNKIAFSRNPNPNYLRYRIIYLLMFFLPTNEPLLLSSQTEFRLDSIQNVKFIENLIERMHKLEHKIMTMSCRLDRHRNFIAVDWNMIQTYAGCWYNASIGMHNM